MGFSQSVNRYQGFLDRDNANSTCPPASRLRKPARTEPTLVETEDGNNTQTKAPTKMINRLQLLPLLSLLLVGASAFVAPRLPISTGAARPSTSTSTSSTSLAATWKKVFVAGGSRGVGRYVIDKLLENGSQVVALVRSEDDCNALNAVEGVKAIQGDAFVIKDVETAMDGCDAAVTTLGGATTDDGKRVDYEGNNHVIESAGILGVTRVVLVTSIGCGDSKEAAPPTVFDTLKEVLAAKEKAENILIKYYTNTNWTIIRPGGLKSEPATGKAILTEDKTAIGSIHREDVAALVVQALESPNTERKVLSAVDPTITSAVSVEGKSIEAFAV